MLMQTIVLIAHFDQEATLSGLVVLEDSDQSDISGRDFVVGECGVIPDIGVEDPSVLVGKAFVSVPCGIREFFGEVVQSFDLDECAAKLRGQFGNGERGRDDGIDLFGVPDEDFIEGGLR